MVYPSRICAPALLALLVLASCKDNAPPGAAADQASLAVDQQVLPVDQAARPHDHTPDSALARTLTDRPDDLSGALIHAMYVLSVDGADRFLDTNGVIAASVAAFNGWLGAQTSGRAAPGHPQGRAGRKLLPPQGHRRLLRPQQGRLPRP
jgi:hypothetical protein